MCSFPRLLTGLMAFVLLQAGFSTTLAPTTLAQTPSVQQLQSDLQTAVCLNDWDQAVRVINPLIGSPHLDSGYRQQLIEFRQQLQTWRAQRASIANIANCEGITAIAPEPQSVSPPASRPLDWHRAAAALPRRSAPTPSISAPTPRSGQLSPDILLDDLFGEWQSLLDRLLVYGTNLQTCNPYQDEFFGMTNVIQGWQGDRCQLEIRTADNTVFGSCAYTQEDIAILTNPEVFEALRSGEISMSNNSAQSAIMDRACNFNEVSGF